MRETCNMADAGAAPQRADPPSRSLRIAYLIGRYPAISHTFILREVEALRRRGVLVITLSIHPARQHDMPSRADRDAFQSTYYLTPPRLRDHLRAHARAIASHRASYLSTMLWSVRAGDPGLRVRFRQLLYFAEAVVCWWRCTLSGISHVHGEFCGPASDAAMLAARLGGPAWTWSFAAHGTDILQVSRARLAAKVKDATFVVCASDFGRSQLMSIVPTTHWEKIEVVRCGVDVREYGPREPDPSHATAELRVLSVGRLEREKGQSLLLDAAAELLLRGRPVTITLIGDGAELEALKDQAMALGISDRVRFLGRVGQDEIRAHYRKADVFCLSSLGEGIPVVLMEAMAMEIPVVAPQLMGIPELVEDGVSGLLFTPGRAPELARALDAIARSKAEREAMGRAGRSRVEREFEVDACAATLSRVFARRLHTVVAAPHPV